MLMLKEKKCFITVVLALGVVETIVGRRDKRRVIQVGAQAPDPRKLLALVPFGWPM